MSTISYRTGPDGETPPETQAPVRGPHRVRTLFISDIHLGTRACKADHLLAFLAAHRCETLYLVGDIVDGWRLKRRWFWRRSHDAVIAAIVTLAQNGTRVIYVPGNHDEVLRPYAGLDLAGVEVRHEAIHTTADGRSLLVMHGDVFDAVLRTAKWLTPLGDMAHGAAAFANDRLNDLRRAAGRPYWSLAGWLKRRVKTAARYIERYENAAAAEAAARGFDGIVCGHIHHAALKRIEGVLYANDGDWVESCTALAEAEDGTLSILTWPEAGETAQAPAAVRPVLAPAE